MANMNIFKKLELWQKIIIGLIAGIIVGLVFGEQAAAIKPVGSMFLNAIRMMVVPVIFTAVVGAIISLTNLRQMARISVKTLAVYISTMLLAAIFGLLMANLLTPGSGIESGEWSQQLEAGFSAPEALSLIDIIVNIIPSNPVAAFAEGNVLQIVVFGIIIGISINLAGEPAIPVANFFNAFLPVVFKLCGIVMWFAPYGIFALIADITGTFGLNVLLPLLKLVGTIWLTCFLVWVMYGIFISLMRLSPFKFFQGAASAITFAMTTSSSTATLPVSIDCAENKLGIPKQLARFMLPIGASLNLNGLCIYLSIVTVFAANFYGVHLSWEQYVLVVVTIIFACLGAGGVPGTGLIVMSAVISAAGLPIGVIALVAGVDRLNDMAQTSTNVLGDLFTATLLAKHEKVLDHSAYTRKDGTLGN